MVNPVPDSSPDETTEQEPSNLDFPVVGIGASAGGLAALTSFFEHMPTDSGMAFVVILHLSPIHESNADRLLQRATTMPVIAVTGPVHIETNHVYIIAPNSQLLTSDGHLCITTQERPVGKHVAVDIFFRALANVHKVRAIAIVLSGTGADGAVGVTAIKEQGGVTLAQSPEDAEYDGMPQSAINTGVVDFILPVAEMPKKLVELWDNARHIRLEPLDGPEFPAVAPDCSPIEAPEDTVQRILSLLCTHTGHDFHHYKRATVLRRIERRMQVRGVGTLESYCSVLEDDKSEYVQLLRDMLIGVTSFFRDQEAFETLENEVIPDLLGNRAPEDEIRVWVAACSSGEEAYSMAMVLSEQAALLEQPPQIQVFASDIDEDAINTARKGIYPLSIENNVSAFRLHQFFTRHHDHYRIRKAIRDRVFFASHNLLRDPPFSKIDIISCRNLLIYLNPNVQAQVLKMFHFALKPGGVLFLGSSESAEAVTEFFTPTDKKLRIYRAKALNRPARFIAPLTNRQHKPTPAKKSDRRPLSYSEIHQQMLMRHGPFSILIDQDQNIVHMSDHASHFLRFNVGEPSRNLPTLVLPELRLDLRTALFQSQNAGHATPRSILLNRTGQLSNITISAYRFNDESTKNSFTLVIFEEDSQPVHSESAPRSGDDQVLHQLETELIRIKEQLQETIEQSEASTEELRATNEELQAINEELRSATEELETSKEELQSVNEELLTVNNELKAKVEESGKANDDLNNLIASTDIATIFVDSEMRVKRFTPRAAEIFNILPTDTGRSLFDLTHALKYDTLATDATNTFRTLHPVEREVRHSDGRYYIARLLPYRTTDDKIDGAVMTFIDITSRREAEERAFLGEERMRLVAESTKDYAIITLDSEGKVTNWNQGAERIFGYAESEILGQSGDIIYLQEDRQRGVPKEEMERALRDGRAEDERWHLRKDGSLLYTSGVLTPLRSGGFSGFAKIARDQTARIKQEGQREAALSQEQIGRSHAESNNALKDQFLAIMSHELRHPLNMIQINVELLSRLTGVCDTPLGIKATSAIRNSVASQAKIIDDLLDMARVNTGKLTLNLATVSLNKLVGSLIDVARGDPSASDISLVLEDCESPLDVVADSVRIEQVVLNLISNAFKFTPAGGTVTVSLSRDGAEARLDVIDTGEGIAAELLPSIFDMFSQAGAVANRNKKGLGIGLALVQQITSLHHGRVQASSDGLGKGACFSLWLPLAPLGPQASASAPAVGLRDLIAGMRILIVEDDEDTSSVFQALLQMEGAKVQIAIHARDALAILANNPIDLLLSDISMPDINGYEFIEKVRAEPLKLKIPAIAISGLGREQDIAACHNAGFSAHISKPVTMERLQAVILDVFSREKAKPDERSS